MKDSRANVSAHIAVCAHVIQGFPATLLPLYLAFGCYF